MGDLPPHIETARLTLRPIEPRDAPALARNLTSAVTQWLASWPDPMTPEIALARIERSRSAMRRGGHVFYALERREDGRMIGGFSGGLTAGDLTRMEIAYHLAEDCHGLGYMREASQAALDAIWERLPIEAVEAGAQITNSASFAVMKAMGMTAIDERMVYSPVRDREEAYRFYELRRPRGP
ncbi:GNAT family N-acetyltransferase [Phenylobacterium sp.]|uniref:GNAT family N-acetyltransferase n=1 Tax=Phenylobacterium sp. TaxID=1871053 RepID=UPI0028A180A9|nr:GNAT family N-acetyltransferase [Phenylobacterium sp.]